MLHVTIQVNISSSVATIAALTVYDGYLVFVYNLYSNHAVSEETACESVGLSG